jgi:hypothetical protein
MKLTNKSEDTKILVKKDLKLPIVVIGRVLPLVIWICCLPLYLLTSCKEIELPIMWLEAAKSIN